MSDMFDSDDYVDMILAQEESEREQEKLRKKGIVWIDSNGQKYKESDIDDSYLQNIIKWLREHDDAGFSDLRTMQKIAKKRGLQ